MTKNDNIPHFHLHLFCFIWYKDFDNLYLYLIFSDEDFLPD